MDQDIIKFGLAAFATLLVVVDPPGVVPMFVALTKGETATSRRVNLFREISCNFVDRMAPSIERTIHEITRSNTNLH